MTQDTFPTAEPGFGAEALASGSQFGAYRIIRLLGAGGMGQVYEAMHVALSKRVAIKTILPEHASRREVVARFLREAQATARIRHPNVVDVTDVGEVDGVPYLVMEFLEGEPLTQRIRSRGRLTGMEAVDLIVPVLGALQAAHEQGIVHRDIKPDNVFLVNQRGATRPTLVDFGISKLLDSSEGAGGGLTKTSLVVGTPYYMAPEQAQDSKRVDARADVYAMGVVLYEMLAGAVPFSGDSLVSILLQIAQGEYPPLQEKRPDLPPALVQAVSMAMALSPNNRFATASDFALALLPFASPEIRSRFERELTPSGRSQPPSAHPIAPQFASHSVAQPTPVNTVIWENRDNAPTVREKAAPNKSNAPWILLAVLMLSLFMGGGAAALYLLFKAEDHDQQDGQAMIPNSLSQPVSTGAPVAQVDPQAASAQDQKTGQIAVQAQDENPAPVAGKQQAAGEEEDDEDDDGAPSPDRPHAVPNVPVAPVAPVASSRASGLAQVNLNFSGDCSPSFNGDLMVGGNDQTVMVNSIAGGRMTGNVTVGACRRPGRYELCTLESAQAGVVVSIVQGMRVWTAIPNLAAQPGQQLCGGTLNVTRVDCDSGIIEARFEDVTLVNPTRTGTCRVNGTLRTNGSNL